MCPIFTRSTHDSLVEGFNKLVIDHKKVHTQAIVENKTMSETGLDRYQESLRCCGSQGINDWLNNTTLDLRPKSCGNNTDGCAMVAYHVEMASRMLMFMTLNIWIPISLTFCFGYEFFRLFLLSEGQYRQSEIQQQQLQPPRQILMQQQPVMVPQQQQPTRQFVMQPQQQQQPVMIPQQNTSQQPMTHPQTLPQQTISSLNAKS